MVVNRRPPSLRDKIITHCQMIDISDIESLEITIDWDGKRVWVNGEDGCLLRAYNIKNLVLLDKRVLEGKDE
jgi:hypothetical protein